MDWDETTRGGLETAINEADVMGVRIDPATGASEVLLEVLALPPTGPLDPDGRRILRLFEPGELRFLLRTDRSGSDGYGPAIPLADLDAVEEFFASLSWGGSIYGWEFFDRPERIADWPDQPSLHVTMAAGDRPHIFYWFNECGRTEEQGPKAYCIEGTVTFERLEVLRADGTSIPLDQFAADGRRVWDAMRDHDDRMSVEAQRMAQRAAQRWRSWAEPEA